MSAAACAKIIINEGAAEAAKGPADRRSWSSIYRAMALATNAEVERLDEATIRELARVDTGYLLGEISAEEAVRRTLGVLIPLLGIEP